MKRRLVLAVSLVIAFIALSIKTIHSTDYSDLSQKEISNLIKVRSERIITYHDNATINKMITYLAKLKKQGLLTEEYLMTYIFADENTFVTKKSRIIADPNGGYWTCFEGEEGDGDVKIGLDGKAELNLFSSESTSIGELQEAVLNWYHNTP